MKSNRLQILQIRKNALEELKGAIKTMGTTNQRNELKMYIQPILNTVNSMIQYKKARVNTMRTVGLLSK